MHARGSPGVPVFLLAEFPPSLQLGAMATRRRSGAGQTQVLLEALPYWGIPEYTFIVFSDCIGITPCSLRTTSKRLTTMLLAHVGWRVLVLLVMVFQTQGW